ncbi:hypothetical protein [Chitinophaga sp. 212800010-3]|uniref:hypothetical protein n=1 Tax=unclassified Chitinophaga TaxID=2619133 RepID=UPI002DF62BDB|nr:hypothetical protein [Chitinophaga sp. 212800010-3]
MKNIELPEQFTALNASETMDINGGSLGSLVSTLGNGLGTTSGTLQSGTNKLLGTATGGIGQTLSTLWSALHVQVTVG